MRALSKTPTANGLNAETAAGINVAAKILEKSAGHDETGTIIHL
jgi:hypothetical protein